MDAGSRFRLVAFAAVVLSVGAACGGVAPTAAPAPAPQPTPTEVPGGSQGAAVTVDLAAANIEFSAQVLEVHANAPFIIHFVNAESTAGVPHNVEIRRMDGVNLVQGQQPIDSGQQAEYRFSQLPAGNYLFICVVHPIPAMTGTLLVR